MLRPALLLLLPETLNVHSGPYKSAQIAALPPLLRSAAIEECRSRRGRGMAQGAAAEEVVYCGAAVETC